MDEKNKSPETKPAPRAKRHITAIAILMLVAATLICVNLILTWQSVSDTVATAEKDAAADAAQTITTERARLGRDNTAAPPATAAAPAPAATPSTPPVSPPPPTASLRITAANPQPSPAASLEKFHLREELRELTLPTALAEFGRRFKTEPVQQIEFPLFDGKTVLLTDFTYDPFGENEGVFYAKVAGEPNGGDAQISYVGQTFTGKIHLPSQNLFYSIRSGGAPTGDTVRSYLTQEDPKLMPVCGICSGTATRTDRPVTLRPRNAP